MTLSARQSPIMASEAELGRYHLVVELARGGMGNVYLAAMRGPGGFAKLLAVKELKSELSSDGAYVAMFLDEARLAARLSHPNIVQTNEVASEGSRHYMVMEFLDGRSLHRILRRLGGRFPVAAHLRVIAESLAGLHYAHEVQNFDGAPLGIVHRDVSPLNVFVTFAGQAKLLDFGIAKALDSSQHTKVGVLKGRVAYMAPEQAKGDKVDRRADIYAAGVMLWEAAARRRLWPGYAEVEILTELFREGPRPLQSVCPDAPEDLDRICARAMAHDPHERYATAAELQSDLEEHLAGRPDAMSMRDIGVFISRTFADEREKMNVVIDEALSRVRGVPRSGVRPTAKEQFSDVPTSANVTSVDVAKPNVRPLTPSQRSSPGNASSLASLSRSAPATTVALGSVRRAPQSRAWSPKHLGLAAAGASALLLGIMFGGRWATRHSHMAAAPAAAPAAATTQFLPPMARNEGELIELAVRVTPASAQITVDGASVANNPFRARYRKETGIHHIVASADGYESRVEDVSFGTDVSIDVSLSKRANQPQTQPFVPFNRSSSLPASPPSPWSTRAQIAKRTPVATAATATAEPPDAPPPAASKADVSASGGRSPLRPIATANPYGSP